MNTNDDAASQQQLREADERARALYWGELVQLTHETEYIRHYRDHVNTILTWFDVGRAVISVGALGSWVAGLGYPKPVMDLTVSLKGRFAGPCPSYAVMPGLDPGIHADGTATAAVERTGAGRQWRQPCG